MRFKGTRKWPIKAVDLFSLLFTHLIIKKKTNRTRQTLHLAFFNLFFGGGGRVKGFFWGWGGVGSEG